MIDFGVSKRQSLCDFRVRIIRIKIHQRRKSYFFNTNKYKFSGNNMNLEPAAVFLELIFPTEH